MANHHDKDEQHDEKKHGYYTGDIHNQFVEEHVDSNAVKIIWKTFWILLAITIFEVGIAFTSIPHDILIVIFIVLTIVKAYYIIAYFMHLKHETVPLKYSIILPFVLILFFVVMAIAEGNYLNLIG
ncbi:MAG: cytochrome C oxidase subunit IV family protein [Bacteroidota bacterium]|nr:cytochrome C oxidase subunit IV family protein [Bacteroidota bacterium]